MTFVIVTHDQEEAMTMASRIGRDERGPRSLQVGAPSEIYETPTRASSPTSSATST